MDLINVSIGFSILFMAFVSICFLMYSSRLGSYRSFMATASYLTTAFLGMFNFESTIEETGQMGAFILMAYLLLMVFLWMNIFISVLNEYVKDVKENKELEDPQFEVIGHLLKSLFSVFSSDNEKEKNNPQGNISIAATVLLNHCSVLTISPLCSCFWRL